MYFAIPYYLTSCIITWEIHSFVILTASKNNKTIKCLLQFHIAEEETKFGFELPDDLQNSIGETLNSDVFLNLKNIDF